MKIIYNESKMSLRIEDIAYDDNGRPLSALIADRWYPWPLRHAIYNVVTGTVEGFVACFGLVLIDAAAEGIPSIHIPAPRYHTTAMACIEALRECGLSVTEDRICDEESIFSVTVE